MSLEVNIKKRLGGFTLDVTFSAGDGVLALLGASGCGKSMTLRCIAGIERPDEGRIVLGDRVLFDSAQKINLPPQKRRVGLLFQNYALFENMTVLGNVEYSLKIKKDTKKDARKRAMEVIEHMGLKNHMDKKPGELSGGQQQRVAIARTLVQNPDIILFDEPMSALDVATRLMLRKVLKDIQAEFQTTMIYITHDQEEAFSMSDRIMVMGEAEIHQIGTPDELLDSPADGYVKSFVIDNLRAKINSLSKFMR